MPWRALILAQRLPSLTPTEFRDYLENKHIPTIKAIAGDTWPSEHRRTYIARSGDKHEANVFRGTQEQIDFDVVIELVYEDEEHMKRNAEATLWGPRAAEIHEDEAKFLKLETLKIVMLGETEVTKGVAQS